MFPKAGYSKNTFDQEPCVAQDKVMPLLIEQVTQFHQTTDIQRSDYFSSG
jgi:hypothetical protein